jgi:hypothetical protein
VTARGVTTSRATVDAAVAGSAPSATAGVAQAVNQSHQKLQNVAPSQSWVLARQGQNS